MLFPGNLRAHILKTHSIPHGGNNVFSCTECSCIFRKLGNLNGHMTRNHSKIKSDVDEALSRLNELQKKTNNEMNNSKNSDILQQAINQSNISDSNIPEAVTHEEPTLSYVTLADMGIDGNMRHYIIKQRKAGDLRWHLCSFCPKEFKKPSDLVRHLRIHTQEKPYLVN